MKSLKTVRHLRQSITHATVLAACQLAAPAVWAATDPDPGLQAQLEARYKGDMSGACVMAAIIEGNQVRRARYCALPEKAALPDWNAAFEIGSITKTMTAFLVSDLIAKGKWSLDDPIALHLPKGTQVPRQGERQILVRDLLTHSSGLPSIPSRMRASNPEDPWADLTEQDVLDSLGDVKLSAPIGSTTAYSNFGMAVVSLAVSRAYGTDYETALRSALFEPLGMRGAYIRNAAPGTVAAQGYKAPGIPTPAWTLSTNLSGIGMVRATLNDMVLYAQAHLGLLPTPLFDRLQATHAPLVRNIGMNWLHTSVKGHGFVWHNGGTGGFRSILYLEPEKQRAVILLSNTSYADGGDTDATALALLDADSPMPKPRIRVAMSDQALKNLPGSYTVAGVEYKVWAEGQQLWVSAPGHAAQQVEMDDRDTFHALGAMVKADNLAQVVNRIYIQSAGEVIEGLRVGYKPQFNVTNPMWKGWAGEYQVMQGFSIRVFEEDQQLYAQGTDQPRFPLAVKGVDQVNAPEYDVVLEFKRNSQGQVTGLTLTQGGRTFDAPKVP